MTDSEKDEIIYRRPSVNGLFFCPKRELAWSPVSVTNGGLYMSLINSMPFDVYGGNEL